MKTSTGRGRHRASRLPIAACLALAAGPAGADWPPAEISNLQVLEEDIELRELVDVMRGFTTALGVRCQHCHVHDGDDPDDLATFDFAADELPAKGKARTMLRLTRTINEELLPAVEGELGLEVTCATCHHGQERPEPIEHLVSRLLRSEGLEAALARYRTLRAEHFGSWVYDFSAAPLDRLARELARSGRAGDAAALLETNLEFHPEAARTHLLYGEVLLMLERRDEARHRFERALELDPGNELALQRLAELGSGPAEVP